LQRLKKIKTQSAKKVWETNPNWALFNYPRGGGGVKKPLGQPGQRGERTVAKKGKKAQKRLGFFFDQIPKKKKKEAKIP